MLNHYLIYCIPACRDLLITRFQNVSALFLNVVFTNLIKDTEPQGLLPLLREVEGTILESPLEGEHVDVRGPVVAGDDDNMALFMETKQQG